MTIHLTLHWWMLPLALTLAAFSVFASARGPSTWYDPGPLAEAVVVVFLLAIAAGVIVGHYF